MNKLLTILFAFLFIYTGSHARVQPEPVSRFSANLKAIIKVANTPSGFDSLKYVELSRGVWNCRLELDGFLPTIEEHAYNPACPLMVSAVSVRPSAKNNVRMLLLKGLPGYKMKDSDTDKTVRIDPASELRRVVFTKTDKFVVSTVTVIFNAHQYNSTTIRVESWEVPG